MRMRITTAVLLAGLAALGVFQELRAGFLAFEVGDFRLELVEGGLLACVQRTLLGLGGGDDLAHLGHLAGARFTDSLQFHSVSFAKVE